MSIGVALFGQTVEHIVALARHAETLGFEHAWLGDHVFVPTELSSRHPYPGRARDPVVGGALHIYDLWVAVGALISATKRMTVSTGVAIAPLRHPLITARAALTAHQMSGGRFRLGIGIGWMPEEFLALDVPFHERAKRTEEVLEILRKIFAGGTTEHMGRFYSFTKTEMTHAPADIPIFIGGTAPQAVRRAALCADGWYSPYVRLDECLAIKENIQHIRTEAGLGAKPYTFHVRATKMDRDTIARYREAGFEHLILTWDAIDSADPANVTLDAKLRALDKVAASVDLVN